jgi:hypothetical protein
MVENAAIGRGKRETPNNCGLNNRTYRHYYSAIVILHARARAAIDPTRSTLLRPPAVRDNAAMQTERTQANPPKRKRRWLQFSLRSLLIGVALLAIPCGYVGWQAKIVRERKAYLQASMHLWDVELFLGHGGVSNYVVFAKGDEAQAPSLIRIWLGDEAQDCVWVESARSTGEKQSAAALFPEALVLEWSEADRVHDFHPLRPRVSLVSAGRAVAPAARGRG